ncbi:MAG: hypothetical protein IT289_10255 [Oligoflexia bacterium]|nr:hypothetical protein [Oligoflexia bacterium]
MTKYITVASLILASPLAWSSGPIDCYSNSRELLDENQKPLAASLRAELCAGAYNFSSLPVDCYSNGRSNSELRDENGRPLSAKVLVKLCAQKTQIQ